MSLLRSPGYPADPHFLRRLGWIVLLALALRATWAIVTPALPYSDYYVYDHLAQSLVSGGGYAENGVVTSYRPPGYPFFLAAVRLVFGDSLLAPKLFNALLGALAVLFTGLIGRRLFSTRVGLIGALVMAVLPSQVLYPGMLASENLAVPMTLGVLLALLRAWQDGWRMGFVWAGLALGLAILVRPPTAIYVVVWFLLAFAHGVRGKSWVLQAVSVALIAMCVVAPWTARNYRVHQAFVPVSTNGGVNLYISFNERSTGRFFDLERAEITGPADTSEVRLDRMGAALARQYIREHPGRSLALAPRKLYYLLREDASGVTMAFKRTSWTPPRWLYLGLVAACMGAYGLLWLSVFIGLRSQCIWDVGPSFAWGTVGACLATHLVFFGDDRFHHPILPFLALLAAVFWAQRRDALTVPGDSHLPRDK